MIAEWVHASIRRAVDGDERVQIARQHHQWLRAELLGASYVMCAPPWRRKKLLTKLANDVNGAMELLTSIEREVHPEMFPPYSGDTIGGDE